MGTSPKNMQRVRIGFSIALKEATFHFEDGTSLELSRPEKVAFKIPDRPKPVVLLDFVREKLKQPGHTPAEIVSEEAKLRAAKFGSCEVTYRLNTNHDSPIHYRGDDGNVRRVVETTTVSTITVRRVADT